MIADRQVGLGKSRLADGLEDQEGQLVDGVLAICRLAANRDVLVHRASCAGECVRLGANLVDGQCFDPEVGEQFNCLFLGDVSPFQVGRQIGIYVLVEAAVAEGVSVGLDLQDQLDEPHSLHCLVESLGRLIRDLIADAGDLKKFGSPGLLRCCCLLAGQRRKALCESLDRIDHDQNGFIELVLVDGFRLSQVQPCLELSCAVLISFQTDLQHVAVVHCKVCVSCVELALHAKEPCVHVDLHLFRHKRLAAGAEVVVLPERSDLAQLLLGLFRNIEDVAVSLLKQVKLVHDELHRVLREDRRSAVDGGLISDQNGLVLNINIHLCQNILQHQRSLHDRRLIQILLIGFCGQDSTLCVDIGFLIQDALAVCLHSGCQGSEMCFVFHLASPLFSFTIYLCSVCSLIIVLHPFLSIYFLQEICLNFIRNLFFTYSNVNAMIKTYKANQVSSLCPDRSIKGVFTINLCC